MDGVRAAPGCPREVVRAQVALGVRYLGFDRVVRDGRIEVHREVADDVTEFFRCALEIGFPVEQVVAASEYEFDDAALMAANATSGFNYRTVAGTGTLSLHALGAAFDVNTRLNPYLRRVAGELLVEPAGATWDPGRPGTLHRDHPLVVLLRDRGWDWGGDWDVPDYQHFQQPRLQP